MVQFHETAMGQKFLTSTVPALKEEIEKQNEIIKETNAKIDILIEAINELTITLKWKR